MTQNANFQVFQASAGSGKTYTIVKEYLKLCLGSERQVDNFRHILAITFTNAAANEMKAKILRQLQEIITAESVASGDMLSELMRELGVGLDELKHNAQLLMTRIIHDYSSFCVSTIDAFVQKLSRSFAHDLGLPGQYTVSVDTEEVAEAITENIGLEINDENTFLVQLLLDFSANRFANQQSANLEYQLVTFAEKLMTEKAYQKDESNNIKNASQYQQTLVFLNDKINGFEREIETQVARFRDAQKRYNIENDDFAYGKMGFVSFVNKLSKRIYEAPSQRFRSVAETGKWYSASAKKRFHDAELEEITSELQPILASMLEYYEKHVGAFLFYKSQRELLYLYALRAKISSEFERLAQENEVVHISEFNKLLNSVMGDFSVPFVYERIGEHFRHVFVDEFQDTSVLQWQNLLPLIDNGLSAGAMSMIVGDGKQSIYRFRSGEVEQIVQLPEIYALPNDEREPAFLQYQQNLKDQFCFHNLGSNFRSYEAVVQFNNDFFAYAFKQLSEPLQKVYQDENEQFGKRVTITQKPEKHKQGMVQVDLYDAENQPDYCLQRIKDLVLDLTQTKGYRLGDITVLVRNSKLGSDIANYLNDNGIPVVSKDSILLNSSDKVQLIVSTLRYLIHSDNEAYIANVLYYRRLTTGQHFDGQIDALFGEVKRIARGEMPIEQSLGQVEVGALSSVLAKATCLYDLCASLIRIYNLDSIRDAFLDYFLEEVFKFQSSTTEGIQEFISFWDRKSQKELSVKSAGVDAVNIMTIHKSKGLEFNVVIYPEAIIDLDEKSNTTPAEEWLRPEELGFEPIPNLDKVLFKLGKSTELMGEKAMQYVENECESNRLDNLNLLYVAFTRAKQRLYVLARQGKADKTNLLRDFLSDETIINKVLEQGEEEGAEWYRFGDTEFTNAERHCCDEVEFKESMDSVSMDWFQRIRLDPEPSMFWISPEDKIQPREWGDLVHQILSEVRTGDDIDSALKPYLLDGTINQETSGFLKDKMEQMTNHPLIGAAFVKEAKVKNECEILFDHEIIRPDRYAELNDVIYLLDYKTGKRDEAHHVQLKKYICALQGMVEKEIRAFLVYIADSIEVEPVVMDTLF